MVLHLAWTGRPTTGVKRLSTASYKGKKNNLHTKGGGLFILTPVAAILFYH